MIAAPRPRNEEERLAALREYQILDTAKEAEFDDIAKIAAHICGAPIALVSLVDEDRQCCKARFGIDPVETPRHVAFCAHAILGPETLVVADATADERFADNPLVTEDPRIRFYAGARLVTPLGHALGTLCAIDRRPRSLEPRAQMALEALARQIVVLLEHRRVSARLARSLERIKLLSGLVPICSHCKRVREDGDYWTSVEKFVRDHSDADFSHGICPECIDEHYPDIAYSVRESLGLNPRSTPGEPARDATPPSES